MKRRSFIGLLGVAAAALVIPERTFFLPPDGGWGRSYARDLFTGERVPIIQTIPFREPSPEFMALLDYMKRYSHDITGVTAFHVMPSHQHDADLPGRILDRGLAWPVASL